MNGADVTFTTPTAFARVKTDHWRVLDERVRVVFVQSRTGRLHIDKRDTQLEES